MEGEELQLDLFQQREIDLGREKGLNVEQYDNPRYSWLQMKEIRLGLEKKLNVKCYSHPGFSVGVMREVRLALESDVSIIRYVKEGCDSKTLRELRLALEEDHNLSTYLKEGYSGDQLREIRLSLFYAKSIRRYITPQMRAVQIAQIRKGLEKGLDVKLYASEDYSWQQMQEIRLGLETHLDVSVYMNKFFEYSQMREIRLGLAAGMDVSSFAKLQYGKQDMRVRRIAMALRYGKKQKESEELEIIVNDTIANIYMTPNKMQAYIELKVQDVKNNYNIDDVMRLLDKTGIRYGIKIAHTHEAVLNENYYMRFLVAEGKKAVQGKNGYYEYRNDEKKTCGIQINTDGSLDYSHVFEIEGVKADQVIARYHFAEDGTRGINVLGEEIPAKKGKELAVLRCEGVNVSDDATCYTAVYDGRVVVTPNSISVYRMLFVEGNYKRGMEDIDFDGDVLIRGSVITGMTVKATHDIIIDGSVEPSTIDAGGSVYIRVGAVGNESGKIKAGLNIYGNYFEKVKLQAQGNVYATSLLGCTVEAYEKVIVIGGKGIILGGNVYAMAGIEADTIGNTYHIKSKLMIGANDDLIKEVARSKAEYTQISTAVAEMQARMEKLEVALSNPEVLAVYTRIKRVYDEEVQEQTRLSSAIEQLDVNMEKDKRARVWVRKDLYPGAMVQAGTVSYTVEDTLRNVLIKNVAGSVKVLYGNS